MLPRDTPSLTPGDRQAIAEALAEAIRPVVREEVRRVVEESLGPAPLLGLDDVARTLGCSERTVRRIVERRELSAIRTGARGLRFHPDALDAYLRARSVAG